MRTHIKTYLFSFFLLLVASPVFSASKIVNIDFVGLVKTEESVLRQRISSFEGSSYSSSKVKGDIKALYDTGFFEDVYVEKKSVSGDIHLIFHVREKGVVRSIIFRGNKKIKEKDLMNVVTIRDFNLLSEKRIAESEHAIRKLYEEKGFYLAEVKAEIVPLDTEKNELELVFRIKENREVKIRRISFVGNKVFSDRKLAKQMVTKVKGFFSFISGSGKYKDEKLERDVEALTRFYQNRGFIKVKIGNPQLSLTRDKKAVYITVPVHEGLKYKVKNVDVAGDIITTREELLSKLKLEAGDIYSREVQDGDLSVLTNLYGDQAYAFANIYPVINTYDEEKVADVTYVVQKGAKITIESIEIHGNTITRDKVIRREMQVKENALYNKSAIDLSQRRLMQLGYFEDVNFSTPRGSRDDRIKLTVKVTEKPTGSFSLGAGFSSLESFIFTASIQKDNFFGHGISGGVSVSLSKLRQEFVFNMTDRYFLDTRWIFSTAIYRFSSALNRDFDQRSFGGSVSFGRELFPFFDATVGYKIEDISVTNFSSQVPAFFQRNASGLTSSAITSLAYDTRDNRIFTTKGMYQAVSGEYSGNGIGGDNDFWKISTESRFFLRLPGKMVLKARGLFSYINSLNDGPVPLFERFFLGGINTLRGFDLNSIGPQMRVPVTATGSDRLFTYGGNRMLLFNLEHEVPIYDPAGLKGVFFVDAGQSFAENERIDISELRTNYGFGVRWNSPFGPLRFEWGFPFKRRSGESFSVFNFSIGQSF